MYEFIDAHTHAQFSAYDNDRKSVIERALKQKIAIINIGTNKETSEKAVKLAMEYDSGMYAAVGLHPIHTSESFRDEQETKESENRYEEIFDMEYYKKLALDKNVVAIGECGLDYFHLPERAGRTKERQRNAFIDQIRLSQKVKKPIMIHCRDAYGDLIEILKENKKILNTTPGIIHFFTGKLDHARTLLDFGFSFTFGGVITFTNDYDEIIKAIPADKVLSETDAPYVTPAPYRGKRNEPAYVIEIVKKLAKIKQTSFETMRLQILKNAENLFNIKL